MQDKTAERNQKFQMIRDWQRSSLTQKQYCRENNITHSSFYYWYRVYKTSLGQTDKFLPLTITHPKEKMVTLTGNNGIHLQLPVNTETASFVKQILLS